MLNGCDRVLCTFVKSVYSCTTLQTPFPRAPWLTPLSVTYFLYAFTFIWVICHFHARPYTKVIGCALVNWIDRHIVVAKQPPMIQGLVMQEEIALRNMRSGNVIYEYIYAFSQIWYFEHSDGRALVKKKQNRMYITAVHSALPKYKIWI